MGSIRKELARAGLTPKKRLGQHFLVDESVLPRIVELADIAPEEMVLEIGPGTGQMTAALAQRAKRVIAVEIDPGLVQVLKNKMGAFSNVEVSHADILKVDFESLFRGSGPIKVVANLPYQISTPLLFKFIAARHLFSTLTLMLQKEVAKRLVAQPGGKDYGLLSIFVQLVSHASIQFLLPPRAFYPPPKVESAVLHMTWRERPSVHIKDEEWFGRVVRGCFLYRRKMLINGLRHSELAIPADAELRMEKIGIDPRRRPETLSIEEFALLADAIKP
jgi:16S rRNA (adenine1518-N6/adenine1519-N6)-dimethyltransferase